MISKSGERKSVVRNSMQKWFFSIGSSAWTVRPIRSSINPPSAVYFSLPRNTITVTVTGTFTVIPTTCRTQTKVQKYQNLSEHGTALDAHRQRSVSVTFQIAFVKAIMYYLLTLSARGPTLDVIIWGRILVQVTIYRRLLIGRDGHLDQSEAYDIS